MSKSKPRRRRQSSADLELQRAVGLTRFSRLGDRDPENLQTTEIQRERIAAFIDADPELEPAGILDERNISGRAALEKRTGLNEALRMIEAGEAEVLIVSYFDRAFRSTKVKQEVVDRVEAAGGRLLALDMGAISHVTAAQWVTSSVMTLVAEYVARSAGERTAAAQERSIRNGAPIMRSIPAGYRKGPDKILEVQEDEARAIREAFCLRADGASLREVRDFLRSRGISYSTGGVRALLRSRIYRGEIKFGEELHNLSAHDPIVSEELWQAAQRTSAPRGRVPLEPRLLSKLGVFVCGTCGARMSLSSGLAHHRAGGKRYAYYRCAADAGDCPQRAYISADVADGEVLEELQRVIGERWQGRASIEADAEEARLEREKAEQAYERTGRSYAASESADEPWAIDELAKLRQRRDAAIERHERLASAAGSLTVTLAREADGDVERRPTLLSEQRDLVLAVFERIRVMPGRGPGRLRFEPLALNPPSDPV